MNNETASGPAGASDGGGHPPGGGGIGSPLQARAAFIKNWSWQSVVSINRGACERGRAQHGINSETGRACEADWEGQRPVAISLLELTEQQPKLRCPSSLSEQRVRRVVRNGSPPPTGAWC